MQASLERISAARNRLWQVAKEDYPYEVVGNQQINALTDEWVAKGILTPNGEWLRNVRLPREIEFAQLNRNAINYRVLGALCGAKRMACVQLVDGIQRELSHNSLLVGFLCLRSLLEQIAHFDRQVTALEKALQNSDADNCNKEVYRVLVKGAYATRIDWQKLLHSCEGDLLDKSIKYKPKDTRADVTAGSVLDAIDGLTQHIEGTRTVYEALCEFAHPNSGVILALTRKMDQHIDDQGVYWLHKCLSMNAPLAGVKDISVFVQRAFEISARCMVHFESRLVEAIELRRAILKTTQVIIQRMLEKRPDCILPYSLCPCGSGKKTKFCCGAKGKYRG